MTLQRQSIDTISSYYSIKSMEAIKKQIYIQNSTDFNIITNVFMCLVTFLYQHCVQVINFNFAINFY